MARNGFTLVEMASVLAVSAALLSVAMPSFGYLVASTRMSSASNDLLADLFLTRSEAMKRKLRVVMCKSRDGQTCAASGGWQQGWIVFADPDGDAMRAAGETLLRVQPPLERPAAADRHVHGGKVRELCAHWRDQAGGRRLPGRNAHGVQRIGRAGHRQADRAQLQRPPPHAKSAAAVLRLKTLSAGSRRPRS
jgi:prepilin-type N-terminal cleavage/methylation domain-containing protein